MICNTPMLAYMRCTTNESIPISNASEINELLPEPHSYLFIIYMLW